MLLDPAKDLRPVDLAKVHLRNAHCGRRVGHAPPVAVELRKRVEIDVTVVYAGVPAEDGSVAPQVAMRHLDALGSGRGARGVVDGGGCRLVRCPGPGFSVDLEQRVGLLARNEPVLHGNVAERVDELGVDDEHFGTRVLDDVPHFVGAEPEIDRNRHTPPGAGAEEGRQKSGGVLRHDPDPGALAEAEVVEPRRHPLGQVVELAIGEIAEARCRLIGFIEDPDPVAVDELRPFKMITDRHRCLHSVPPAVVTVWSDPGASTTWLQAQRGAGTAVSLPHCSHGCPG